MVYFSGRLPIDIGCVSEVEISDLHFLQIRRRVSRGKAVCHTIDIFFDVDILTVNAGIDIWNNSSCYCVYK
jgi:hypothetical protein